MLTAPTSIHQDLVAGSSIPVEVYEIALDAETLRFAGETLTWPATGGNAYTRLAMSRGPIKEEMAFRVPEVEVAFSNVNRELAAYFEPEDKLTGAELTVRLLMRNPSTLALRDESLVLFVGQVERPRRVDEERFRLKAVGPLKGAGIPIPRRRTHPWCPWEFADGVNCPYVGGETSCDRSFDDCTTRGMTHHFGGFRETIRLGRRRYIQGSFRETL